MAGFTQTTSDRRQIYDALMSTDQFVQQGLLPEEVEGIVNFMKVVPYAINKPIYTIDRHSTELFVLQEGSVAGYNKFGREEWSKDAVAVLGAEDFFVGTKRGSTVRATKPSIVYSIKLGDYYNITAKSYVRKIPAFNSSSVSELTSLLPYIRIRIVNDGKRISSLFASLRSRSCSQNT